MNAKEYKERALKYFDEGNYDGAIADLNEVIRLEPDNHSAYYMRGGAYVFKQNKTLAISDLEMAVKLDPQNKDYRERLEELKNIKTPSNSETSGLKGFLIKIIIGGVIGGGLGLLSGLVGLFIGLFFGIGLGQFLSETKENFISHLGIGSEAIKRQIAEDGVIKGFFFAFFMSLLVFLFFEIWYLIKSPFVTIYRLITGDYYFGSGF